MNKIMPLLIRILLVSMASLIYSSATPQSSKGELLKKYVTNFPEEVYGKNAQNWSICEDYQGVIYFGNFNCIISFNGVAWSTINIPGNVGFITGLMYGPGDTIFWGGSNDFGFLVPNSNGEWQSTSLRNKVPELDRFFSQVWRIFSHREKVVFFTQESVFTYNKSSDSVTIIYPIESFHLAFSVANQLFARDRGFGLMSFDGENFIEIHGGDVFRNDGVFGLFEIKKDSFLVVSQTLGFFNYSPVKNLISKINSIDNDFVVKQEVMGGLKLKNGLIALNTASSGLLIVDGKGIVRQRINLESGIADNDVKWVHQDSYGNLWLATNNGVSMINYNSIFSFYLDDEKSSLPGSANLIQILAGQIYVGTTSGLFRYDNESFKFEQIKGLTENITALKAVGDEIFAGTTSAIYVVKNSLPRKILDADIRSIDFSKRYGRLYVSGNNGFFVLDKKSGWKTLSKNDGVKVGTLKSLLIENDNGSEELWLGTFGQGLLVLDFNKDANPKITIIDDIDGNRGGWCIPMKIKNRPSVAMGSGLWVPFHDKSKSVKADSNNRFLFVPSEFNELEKAVITSVIASDIGDIAIVNGKISLIDNDGRVYSSMFEGLNIGKINDMLLDDKGKLWVASNKGVIVIDKSEPKPEALKPFLRVDKMVLSDDSVLFNRTQVLKSRTLDFGFNSFTIRFSSSYSEVGNGAKYSYKLEKYDETWSEWSEIPYAEYKKVHEGTYVFRVKAKDVNGNLSEELKFEILILPPWYRTIWAYFSYLIFVVTLIFISVRIYTYRLKQKNIQLEAIIVERTREIVEQKSEIERQRDAIEEAHAEIQSSIQYAKRIQNAVLPRDDVRNAVVSDYFIIFKPRDVVSGDFYWARQIGDYLVITVADCTGHGVPGAFMSMFGVSLLNDIVVKSMIVDAGEILAELRNGIIKSFNQDNTQVADSNNIKDGMDISLVSINLKTGELTWAGAFNPLFIVSEQDVNFSSPTKSNIFQVEGIHRKLTEVKADKMPIAISENMKPFVSHSFKLNSGDLIYLFSDGFVDQFGGPSGKKFMVKAFRELLLGGATLKMAEQKQYLEDAHQNWVNYPDEQNHEGYHQVDDITIIGLKF